MEWPRLLSIVALSILGTVAVIWLVRGVWHLEGRLRIRRAGPRPLRARRHRIWRQPEPDPRPALLYGPGGRAGVPRPPFRFVQEHFDGSQACVAVRDARDRLWRVKWGPEARPEAFAVRIASACGYFAEVTHFVPHGVIDGVGRLERARDCLDERGRFTGARFELEDRRVGMHFDEHSWSWEDNPFVGTRELNGLKILTMLVSNWDTKDRRDVARGSNTAIFEVPLRWGQHEARYLIMDWGGAMGRWGANVVTRGRWDADGFEAQTPQFVTGVRDGFVTFGYQGQRTAEIARDILVEDVAWFFGLARRLPEPALREALVICGAEADEASRFTRALADRIRQLGEACGALPGRLAKAG